MIDMIAVFLADPDGAADVLRALEVRHSRGCLTIFGVALIDRAADGNVRLLSPSAESPGSALLARLVGMLVAAARPGATLPADMVPDFVADCLDALTPGTFALLAELGDHWLVAAETAIAGCGGTVIRHRSVATAEDRLAREVSALDTELQALEREAEDASGAATAAIRRRAAADRRRLAVLADRGAAGLAAMQSELQSRLEVLEEQYERLGTGAHAGSAAQVRIALAMARLRAEAELRAGPLHEAMETARQALGTDMSDDG